MNHKIDPRCHEKVSMALALFMRFLADAPQINPAWAYQTARRLAHVDTAHAESCFFSAAVDHLVFLERALERAEAAAPATVGVWDRLA